MSRFKLLYFVIFIINLFRINAQISDKRLCVDEECKVPISYARTLLRYSSPDSRILSFAPNVDITIYSKSAGSRVDLWGGEINGKRGYVPKHLVRETKILHKPELLVDTEFSNDTETKQVPSQVEPDKVQEPYEVVDGTTLYLNPQDAINPTSTDSPIQSTALPVTEAEAKGATDSNKQEPSKDGALKAGSEPSKKQETPSADKVAEVVSAQENQEAAPEKEDAGEDDDDDDAEDEEIDVEDDADEEDEELEISAESAKPAVEATKKIEPEPKISSEVKTEENASNSNVEVHSEMVEDGDKTEGGSTASSEKQVIEEESNEQTVTSQSAENPVVVPVEAQKSISVLDSVTASKENEVSINVTEENKEEDAQSDSIEDEIAKKEEFSSKMEEISAKTEEISPSKGEISSGIDNIETTTLTPEIEVPQPFDDGLMEVTPNPLEAVSEKSKVEENIISTLPPLGLFNSQIRSDNTVSPDSENAQSSQEDILLEQSKETISQENEEIANDSATSIETDFIEEETVKELNDFAFNEDDKQINEHETDSIENKIEEDRTDSGFFSGIMSFFGGGSGEKIDEEKVEEELTSTHEANLPEKVEHNRDLVTEDKEEFCDATSCRTSEPNEVPPETVNMELFSFNSDILLYLVTTAISVIIFLFGYIAFDKSKREGPLIAKINNLEKELLITVKENQILQEKVAGESGYDTNDRVSSEVVDNLKQDLAEMSVIKSMLEEQVQSLEKELENSTEVGMELNRMLSEILSSEGGSDVLKANVENLQRQLVEQQATINSVNQTLAVTNTENHELKLELELSNKKVVDLQTELDKLLLNILKIEEEKDTQQATLENEIVTYRQKYDETRKELTAREEEFSNEIKQLKNRLDQTERSLQLKMKEYDILTDTVKQMKAMKNDGSTLQSLLDVSGIKAELQLLKTENQRISEKLQQEQEAKMSYERRAQGAIEEAQQLKHKYDEADNLKVEAQTKLEVLSNYFKDKEAQLQKEISKHESLWMEKQGEATTTTERMKFMQEQLQNYKAQTESLKQEIMSQEVELKSQISVLEKKVHENWVSARQAERKLEDAKQEAAQLRHRLTLRERAIQEDKNQHRLQSPIEQNGDMPVSPLESPASPPLLYGTRDHITKSPPIPGLPPFLPPPPGVPFMPPPLHGVPPFIPPPPNMFPGDHRPPPLGRMSSPPLNSRYSPSSRGYSPYDRNSSSPSDSEYGTSPPHRRGYSPFNNRGEDRRDYKRPPPGRSNGRNIMKGGGSSGSGNSNESLEKINRQQSKV